MLKGHNAEVLNSSYSICRALIQALQGPQLAQLSCHQWGVQLPAGRSQCLLCCYTHRGCCNLQQLAEECAADNRCGALVYEPRGCCLQKNMTAFRKSFTNPDVPSQCALALPYAHLYVFNGTHPSSNIGAIAGGEVIFWLNFESNISHFPFGPAPARMQSVWHIDGNCTDLCSSSRADLPIFMI